MMRFPRRPRKYPSEVIPTFKKVLVPIVVCGFLLAACTDDTPATEDQDVVAPADGATEQESAQGSEAEESAPSEPAHTGGGPPPGVGTNADDEERSFSPRVRKGEFEALGGGSPELEGTASLIRLPDGGALLNLEIEGLEPRRPYDAYLHTGSCRKGGGDLYLFEPSAAPSKLNKQGGGFQADEDGEASEISFPHSLTAGPQAVSVVVSYKGGGTRVACADLKATK